MGSVTKLQPRSIRFRPTSHHLAVRRLEADAVSPGGILLPDVAQQKPWEAVVEAVGPGYRKPDGTMLPLAVGVGDRILYSRHAGYDVVVDGNALTILKEGDILGIVG